MAYSRAKNWTEYYKRLVDESPSSLLSANVFTNFLNISKSNETADSSSPGDLLTQLTKDNGDSILLYAAKGSEKVHLLHSIGKIGGWNFSGSTSCRLVALDGFKTKKATAVIIDQDCFDTDLELDAPLTTRLNSASTIEELEMVEPPSKNGTKFESRPYILLHPYLWETAIDAQDKSPENMFLVLKERFEMYENLAKDDKDLTKAILNYKIHVLTFLWAFAKHPRDTPSLTFHLTGEDDLEFDKWTKQRHLICIEEDALLPEKLKESFHSTGEESQISKSELLKCFESAAKNSWSPNGPPSYSRFTNKIPEETQQLIFNATTNPDLDKTIVTTTKECSMFFEFSNITSAICYFDHAMKTKFNSHMHHVAHECLTRIHQGQFLWFNEVTPSAFSIFNFEKKSPISFNEDNQIAEDILFLKVKQEIVGKLSNDELKGLVKKGMKCPRAIEDLKFRIETASKISSFFFGPDSELVCCLDDAFNFICKNQMIFESQANDDNWFVTKFLYAIDSRIQIWLMDCSIQFQRKDVNDNVIDFYEICNQVKLRTFSINLPEVFIRSIEPTKRKANSSNGNYNHGGTATKKQKGNDDDSSKAVSCPETNKDWLVERKIYNKFLKPLKGKKDIPRLDNGKKMCCKWLSNGYCFSDCVKVDSHVSIENMSEKEKEAYSTFIEGIKRKANA